MSYRKTKRTGKLRKGSRAKRALAPSREKGEEKELTLLRLEMAEANRLIKIISRGKYQWQATFDAILDPVMIVSRAFEVVRANIGVARVAGRDVRSIIGGKCYSVFAQGRERCLGCPVQIALSENGPRSAQLEDAICGRDYVANAFPYLDKVDGREAVVVHYRDVTEEKRLQQELVQQEKMAAIGMLAGGVAHEINNPLGGIIAFAQLIKRDLSEGEPLYGDVSEIERAALRCKKIVQDLLDFSRISSDKNKHWLEINPLIEKVTPFIRAELKSQNIELITDFGLPLPRVYGDANRLQQVFLNLLTNACHAMDRGGQLKIRTYEATDNSAVCVEVVDTGCGVPKDILSKIFDPFFTTKRPGEGTGLGLSISYRIVRDHGGRIGVQSREGKGSAFTVYLPTVKQTNGTRLYERKGRKKGGGL